MWDVGSGNRVQPRKFLSQIFIAVSRRAYRRACKQCAVTGQLLWGALYECWLNSGRSGLVCDSDGGASCSAAG
jgi:hypothetical protein